MSNFYLNHTNTHIDEVRDEEDQIFIQINTGLSVTVVLSHAEFRNMLALLRAPRRDFDQFMSLQRVGPNSEEDCIFELGRKTVYIRFRMNRQQLKDWAEHLEKELAEH